jgi:hypothetical protein
MFKFLSITFTEINDFKIAHYILNRINLSVYKKIKITLSISLNYQIPQAVICNFSLTSRHFGGMPPNDRRSRLSISLLLVNSPIILLSSSLNIQNILTLVNTITNSIFGKAIPSEKERSIIRLKRKAADFGFQLIPLSASS